MNLTRLMTDKVWIENRDGRRTGPYKTKFGGSSILIFEAGVVVAEGDHAIRTLPGGNEQAYFVEGVSFNPARGHIPEHFSLRIAGAALAGRAPSIALETPADRVDAFDAEALASALDMLRQAIERSNFPVEQQRKALDMLDALRQEPVVAAVLGVVASVGAGAA